MVEPGHLNQSVTFQATVRTADGGGGFTETWQDVPSIPTVWAQVRAKSGREGMIAGRESATAVYEFVVWYRADITEGDRIVWGGDNYNIRAIDREGGRKQYLWIHAERGVNQ